MTAQSKTLNIFARSNTGVLSSNPNRDIYVCIYAVFVLSSVGRDLVKGLITRPRGPTYSLLDPQFLINGSEGREAIIRKIKAEEEKKEVLGINLSEFYVVY